MLDSHFVKFISHGSNMQIKHNGTHRITMCHNIQALPTTLQCSHDSHTIDSILIVCD